MRFRQLFGVLCGLVAGVVASAPDAATLRNGSFEVGPDLTHWEFIRISGGATSIDSWVVLGGTIDYLGPVLRPTAGNRSIDLDGNRQEAGGIAQTFATEAGREYAVTFDISGNVDGGETIKRARVEVADYSGVFSFDTAGMTWQTLSYQSVGFRFRAVSDLSTLSFVSLTSAAGRGWGAFIDNVAVEALPEVRAARVAPVPLPGAIWGLLAGLISLVGLRRFRRAA